MSITFLGINERLSSLARIGPDWKRRLILCLPFFLLAACAQSPSAAPLPTRIPVWPTAAPVQPAPASAPAVSASTGDGALGLGGEGQETASAQVDLYAVQAPEFPDGLEWLNSDRSLSLAELRGKIVLLDFWTYGCINCFQNFPFLKRLEEQYPDELVVIGVHSAKFAGEGRTENIRQVLQRYDIQHPVINDANRIVWYAWNVRAWPTLVLVDPNGAIASVHVGEGFYGPFNSLIRQLIQSFDQRGRLDRSPLPAAQTVTAQLPTVLSFPGKVLADAPGKRLFIADTNHNRIVIADASSGQVQALIGSGVRGFADGDSSTAAFAWPQGLALSPDGDTLYVADTGNHAIRAVHLPSRAVRTLAGTGAQSVAYPPQPGRGTDAPLASPWDIALDGENLYIAMTGSHQIWRLHLPSGEIVPFAGTGEEGIRDGPADRAALAQPSGLALPGDGWLYFVDSESSTVRRVSLPAQPEETPVVETVAGPVWDLFTFGVADGVGRDVRFQHPLGIAADPAAGLLYIADTYNNRIRRVDPASGRTDTFLGSDGGWQDGADPLFDEPGGLALAGGRLFVADTNNHSIRVVDLADGTTETVVLKNIQQFTPGADSSAYAGNILQLPPVQVGAGPGRIALGVAVPDGYKLNELAPFSLRWQADGPAVSLPEEAEISVANPAFPLAVEATFAVGQARLLGDVAIVYCQAITQDICLFDEVRLELPVQVAETGPSAIDLTYEVALPPGLP